MKADDPNNVTRGHSSRRARASRVTAARKKPAVAPVVAIRPNPIAWAHALSIAGDPKRLAVQPDGSVIVYNNPIR